MTFKKKGVIKRIREWQSSFCITELVILKLALRLRDEIHNVPSKSITLSGGKNGREDSKTDNNHFHGPLTSAEARTFPNQK